jgi:molybdate transport system substrate-binding protein
VKFSFIIVIVRPLYFIVWLFVVGLSSGLVCARAYADVLVAAASSVRMPLEKLLTEFQRRHDEVIQVSFGSSGNLTHQILRGAPFDIFLSADTEYPNKISQSGLIKMTPQIYAQGSLDIYAGPGSRCQTDTGLLGLVEQLRSGSIQHIAIANPELAPYGRAARQSLGTLGLWEELSPALVIGNSASQAAQYAFSGAADCALISHSLSSTSQLSRVGHSSPIKQDYYELVSHGMVLINESNVTAREFFRYLLSEEATQVFIDAGFTRPLENQ